MSIQEALDNVTEWNMLDVFFPKWVIKLPVPQYVPFRSHRSGCTDNFFALSFKITFTSSRLKRYRTAHATLMSFMRAQIAERRSLIQGGTVLRRDAFTMLVKANEDEEAKFRLDDDELVRIFASSREVWDEPNFGFRSVTFL